jgi:hypothetical protein
MEFSKADAKIIDRVKYKSARPTLGGDPEFFITDKKGKILSADKFLPGKEEPLLIGSRKDSYPSKLFFDGIQAEMAVAFDVCREYFADNIVHCWRKAFKSIPPDHKIILRPSARVSKDVIEDAHPEARIFGCMPDFNAYTCTTNTDEMDATSHPYRYAGGHMHFGVSSPYVKEEHEEYKISKTEEGHLRAIKFFDLLITLPTLLLDNGPGSAKRKEKYGKAGCFRPTPYGVEYRTPSCWWLRSPLTVSLVFGLGRLAWMMMVYGVDSDIREALGFSEEDIRGAIDESDTKTVKGIWNALRPYVALAGSPNSNPLHITSVITTNADRVNENYTGMSGTLPRLSGAPVFALAAFEYALVNGLDVIAKDDIRESWHIGGSFRSTTGWVNGSFNKLYEDKDFSKFQSSFFKEIFPNTKVSYISQD